MKEKFVTDELSLEEAKEIEELDLDKMMNLEEQKKLFKELKEMIKSDHPMWDDWGISYWAVTLMKVQLAIGGDIISLLTDRDVEPGYISIIGKPDYGS